MAKIIWKVSEHEWVYESTNEDGEPVYLPRYHVALESPAGDRYITRRTWGRSAPERRLLLDHILRVEAALRAGADPRRSDKWVQSFPAYGSEAYERYGQREEVAWERAMEWRG